MMATSPRGTSGNTTPSSDGTTATQDAPPQDQKAEMVDEDITSKPGALNAVRPNEPVQPLSADADYVEYKGKATTRRITVEQWKQAKVDDQEEVVWDKSNDFRVDLSDLNEKAQMVLARDPSFAFPAKK